MESWDKSFYNEIKGWFISRAMVCPDLDLLPPNGVFIKGVAAGFLVKTDCGVALLDFVITNPFAKAVDRNLALDQIFSEICFKAVKMGFKYIKGETVIGNMGVRAEKHGFKPVGQHELYMKEL